MMGFRTLAFTYILGGFTFLPLLSAAILISAWYLLPRIQQGEPDDENKTSSNCAEGEDVGQQPRSKSQQDIFGDAAASATFAVLRRYDFQAAIAAINAKSNAGATNAGGSHVTADGSLAADGISSGSESVYQSMYRSVFAGNRNSNTTTLLDDETLEQSPPGRRKGVPASLMHIVLRHGHLMLYASPAQVEVKHVISLAHHKVTLQAGREDETECDERTIMEADIFTKRTAIVLTPVELPNGALQQSNSHKPSRPFYLFSPTNIDKEDFYHALLATRDRPPTPRQLDPEALIKLQSTLHSSSLTPETRALNALLGRVFLGIYQTEVLVNFVRSKIEKKLRKIQKPSFIPVLEIRSLDLGDSGPVLSNLKLRDLNISGDTTISADMRYNGGLSLTLFAVAKLDLGPRFKARTVDLVLKTSLQRVNGTMLLRIKPPPSNRIWFTFESMPELDVRVEPVVSERKITYGFVLRAIEERVRGAFGEGLVKPNWDDVPMPLQDTRGSHARGGLWTDEGEEDHPDRHPEALSALTSRAEKTMSVASLPPRTDSGMTTGLAPTIDSGSTKLRHSLTMPAEAHPSQNRTTSIQEFSASALATPEKGARPPKPLRSPSISSMSPSVAVDGLNAERVEDSSFRSTAAQGRKLWRPRGNPTSPQTQKDALDELRDLRARAEQAIARPSAVAVTEAENSRRTAESALVHEDDEVSDQSSFRSREHSDGSESTVAQTPRSFSLRSNDSDRSAGSLGSSANLPRSQQFQQRKTTILAAAGAATNAARTWGWNALQKNRGAFQRNGTRPDQPSQTQNEPMGRGQPLPPPGMPLPGPQKPLFGGMGTTRRKPVPNLPPRRPRTATEDRDVNSDTAAQTFKDDSQIEYQAEDEFGTWQENPGADSETPEKHSVTYDEGIAKPIYPSRTRQATDNQQELADEADLLDFEDDHQQDRSQHDSDTVSQLRKIPPPLPKRRSRNAAEDDTRKAMSVTQDDGLSGPTEPHAPEVDHEIQGSGLRVPEDAADSIAAENSTAELAHGAVDEAEEIDEDNGIDAQVKPVSPKIVRTPVESLDESAAATGKLQVDDRLDRTLTEERFLRGEDVTEEDFSGNDTEQLSERNHDAIVGQEKTRHTPKKSPGSLKAQEWTNEFGEQIQMETHRHASGAANSAWHGGPKGTTTD